MAAHCHGLVWQVGASVVLNGGNPINHTLASEHHIVVIIIGQRSSHDRAFTLLSHIFIKVSTYLLIVKLFKNSESGIKSYFISVISLNFTHCH